MVGKVQFLMGAFFIISGVLFGVYLAIVKDSAKSRVKLLLYLITMAILLGMTALLGLTGFKDLPLTALIAAEVWALTLGILHAWLFGKIIPLQSGNAGRILFTLAACFLSFALVTMIWKLYLDDLFPLFYLLPGLFFVAPVFVEIAFTNYVSIPATIFKRWEFPPPGTLSDPSDNEMADPVIVNLHIRKQPGESRTVFKAKAPKGMALGRLLYFFIMDYNSRHPDNPIMITEADNRLCVWSFSASSGFLAGKTHLDPDLSISKNRIKENTSVICERVS